VLPHTTVRAAVRRCDTRERQWREWQADDVDEQRRWTVGLGQRARDHRDVVAEVLAIDAGIAQRDDHVGQLVLALFEHRQGRVRRVLQEAVRPRLPELQVLRCQVVAGNAHRPVGEEQSGRAQALQRQRSAVGGHFEALRVLHEEQLRHHWRSSEHFHGHGRAHGQRHAERQRHSGDKNPEHRVHGGRSPR
jgi:hypothetical protein